MTRIVWLVLIFLVGSLLPAQERIAFFWNNGRASLDLSTEGPIALADTIHVVLTVEGSPALVVDAPGEMPAESSWMLVERRQPVRETIGPNRERWHFNYDFAPREPGKKVAFTFPTVKFKDGQEEQSISFAPAYYEITTQIKDADLSQLKGIPNIEPLPPLEPADYSWLCWSALAGVCVFGIMLVLVFRRLFRRLEPRSPAHLALQEWHRLVALKLPENGKSERFITLLTTLVRRYLERQFTLPARRRTTPEFLAALTQVAALSTQEKRFLSSFLQRCEAIKFAKMEMPPDECSQWAEAARQFLEGGLKRQASKDLAVQKIGQSG